MKTFIQLNCVFIKTKSNQHICILKEVNLLLNMLTVKISNSSLKYLVPKWKKLVPKRYRNQLNPRTVSSCSTVVECQPTNLEVMSWNLTRCWAFSTTVEVPLGEGCAPCGSNNTGWVTNPRNVCPSDLDFATKSGCQTIG